METPVCIRERKNASDEMVCMYAGAMGRALLHKIAEPSSAAPPSRDSCKQTRVNLKMQIPPRDSAAPGADTGKKKRAIDRETEREREETGEDERGKKSAARENTTRVTHREKGNFTIYGGVINHSVVNVWSDLRRCV